MIGDTKQYVPVVCDGRLGMPGDEATLGDSDPGALFVSFASRMVRTSQSASAASSGRASDASCSGVTSVITKVRGDLPNWPRAMWLPDGLVVPLVDDSGEPALPFRGETAGTGLLGGGTGASFRR